MRHRVAGRKLGRNTSHRKAMFRNMAVALFTHETITTTIPKAKALKPFVEKLITAAKKGDLASRRRVLSELGADAIAVDRDLKQFKRGELRNNGFIVNRYHELQRGPRVVKKLFDEIGPRYADRPGGYTRIVRLSKSRIGDGADLCVLMLVGGEEGPQLAGQYSRRREKANRRNEKAAAMRKQASKSDNQSDEADSEAADTAVTDDAEAAATEAAEAQDEAAASEESEKQE